MRGLLRLMSPEAHPAANHTAFSDAMAQLSAMQDRCVKMAGDLVKYQRLSAPMVALSNDERAALEQAKLEAVCQKFVPDIDHTADVLIGERLARPEDYDLALAWAGGAR
jgi:hypothetical protein